MSDYLKWIWMTPEQREALLEALDALDERIERLTRGQGNEQGFDYRVRPASTVGTKIDRHLCAARQNEIFSAIESASLEPTECRHFLQTLRDIMKCASASSKFLPAHELDSCQSCLEPKGLRLRDPEHPDGEAC